MQRQQVCTAKVTPGTPNLHTEAKMNRMERCVGVDGRRVRFGNFVGTFLGKDYTYTCATPEDAEAFAEYLKGRAPDNPNMPTAITDEIRRRFHAR